MSRRVLLSIGIGAAVLLAAGAVWLRSFGTGPLPPLPNPNGYYDLLKAGQTIATIPDYVAKLDHDELRSFVTNNAEALRLLRVGLTRRCSVPTDAAIANYPAMTGDLMALKSLARLLYAEGRLAEMENRPADAARSYIDSIRLGNEMSRGGFIINRLVGIACEGVGSIPLVKLIPKLTCEQTRPLVAELEQIDRGTVAWREVLANEERFVRAQMGNYPNPIKLASDLWEAKSVRKASGERHVLTAAHLKLLTTELALRSYRCDHGKTLSSLQELVPKYLERVPSDPCSDQALVYRADGTNWVLYSLGPDKVDDGGKPVNKSAASEELIGLGVSESNRVSNKGDLFYDSPW